MTSIDEMLVEAANRHLLFPCGPMELEFIGNVMFLLMTGGAIAKRENGKWLLLEPGWSQWLEGELRMMMGQSNDLH